MPDQLVRGFVLPASTALAGKNSPTHKVVSPYALITRKNYFGCFVHGDDVSMHRRMEQEHARQVNNL
ncbi:MAG: hypothetical protein V3V89_03730 [Gammaproteobacteria bacterium]